MVFAFVRLWVNCFNVCALYLQTSQNFVQFYAVHVRKEALLPSALFAAKDIPRAEIYLKNSYRVEREAQCLCVSADSRLILLGFADGSLSTLSWSGKVGRHAHMGCLQCQPQHMVKCTCVSSHAWTSNAPLLLLPSTQPSTPLLDNVGVYLLHLVNRGCTLPHITSCSHTTGGMTHPHKQRVAGALPNHSHCTAPVHAAA